MPASAVQIERAGDGCTVPRSRALRLVAFIGEATVLGLVAVSPWLFGAVTAFGELVLKAGMALLLALWAVRMLLEQRFTWKKSPVALCLAGLFLLGILQITPLPRALLTRLSPATAALYDRLLPAVPEAVPDEARAPVEPPPGTTLSLYPGATRADLLHLTAVFCLFAFVLNNLSAAEGLRRLSLLATANGTLLALFALVQYFTSDPSRVFWKYATLGQVFGPFVNRNHFAFYMNLCIGLAVGYLLLVQYRSSGRYRRGAAGQRVGDWHGRAAVEAWTPLLNRPALLWVAAALAVMAGSALFSLSRGGMLALVGAVAVCLMLRAGRLERSPWLMPAACTLAMLAGVLLWLGFDHIESRVALLWNTPDLGQQGRLALWSNAWSVARNFPVWGTGYGTFESIEPLYRTVFDDATATHAENEYVEALAEGGVIRLALTLAGIGLVFWVGFRAARYPASGSARRLALGAMFAFATVVIHSLVDFGIHIPAITFLVVVIAAYLCALGSIRAPRYGEAKLESDEYSFRFAGLAPAAGAGAALALGLILVVNAWRTYQAEQAHTLAVHSGKSPRLAMSSFEKAASLAPENASYAYDLAQAHLDRYESVMEKVEAGQKVSDAAGAVAAPASFSTWLASAAARQALMDDKREQMARDHLVPALREMLRARDLCPLMPEPHVRIAAHCDRLAQGDTRGRYVERAVMLAPCDPRLWYVRGLHELEQGDAAAAWTSWQRSLALSPRYLTDIVDRAAGRLGPDELVDRILPDNPQALMKVLARLYPEESATGRVPFLQHALDLLKRSSRPQEAEDWHFQGYALAALARPEEAAEAYRTALIQDPSRVLWRYELAEVLWKQQKPRDARRELQTVLDQQPGNAPARALLEKVTLEIARKQ